MYYFKDCNTLDEAKNLFKTLCKKLHPDTSGYDSQKDFIEMYKQFEKFSPSEKRDSDESFNAEKFYNLVKLFDNLTGIKINFVGSFIWLEDIEPGAMYRQKNEIKEIIIEGYNRARWASKKISWYFSPVDYTQKSKGVKDLEQIKAKYGVNSFAAKGRALIK